MEQNKFYSQVDYGTDGLQDLWKREFEAKSVWGHRIYCFAFLIGYPLTSILTYLNGNPDYRSIFVVQLCCSLLLGLTLYLHFNRKINGQDASFYSRMLLLIFHSFILARYETIHYYDLSINLTLQLIFSVWVLRWTFRYAFISSVATIFCVSLAFYINKPEALEQFVQQGGLFFFLGQAVFPFILQMRYNKQYREFVYFNSIQRQNKELEKQNELTREATQAKSDFLSVMSHEIRTPLNGIVGIIHLMLQENLRTPFQRELVETLKFSSDHLMAVVNDILDFNKINSNHVVLAQEPFDLSLLLSNLEKTFIPRIREKKLDLLIEIDPALPAQLSGDPVRLNQIITNLIHNAVKFTEKGFVKLVVREEKRDEKHIWLYFEIVDTGLGIPLEEQPTIFEIFTQGAGEVNRSNRGTGLGLAITKELLRLFGSTIQLKSEPGRGSCFSFLIEFSYSEEKLAEAKPECVKITAPEARILVVDDNAINLLLATNLLKKVGFQYDTAENGAEAVGKFKSMHYDLVLMDLRMPVMNGFEATSAIRELGSQVPIIAVTASAFTDEREKAMSSGFSAYLVKPFLPDEFYGLIYTFLRPEEPKR